MGYYLASEGSRRIESKAVGKDVAQRWSAPVPTGTCHAVAAGVDRTACGANVDGLVLWEQPWSQGFLGRQRCRECSAVVANA